MTKNLCEICGEREARVSRKYCWHCAIETELGCSLQSILKELRPETYPYNDIGAGNLFADVYKDIARVCYNGDEGVYCWQTVGCRMPFYLRVGGELVVAELCKELAMELLEYAAEYYEEHHDQEFFDYCLKWGEQTFREKVLKEAFSVYVLWKAEM